MKNLQPDFKIASEIKEEERKSTKYLINTLLIVLIAIVLYICYNFYKLINFINDNNVLMKIIDTIPKG